MTAVFIANAISVFVVVAVRRMQRQCSGFVAATGRRTMNNSKRHTACRVFDVVRQWQANTTLYAVVRQESDGPVLFNGAYHTEAEAGGQADMKELDNLYARSAYTVKPLDLPASFRGPTASRTVSTPPRAFPRRAAWLGRWPIRSLNPTRTDAFWRNRLEKAHD